MHGSNNRESRISGQVQMRRLCRQTDDRAPKSKPRNIEMRLGRSIRHGIIVVGGYPARAASRAAAAITSDAAAGAAGGGGRGGGWLVARNCAAVAGTAALAAPQAAARQSGPGAGSRQARAQSRRWLPIRESAPGAISRA